MILRLTLAARVVAILIVSIIAIWMVLLATQFWLRADRRSDEKPPPARIAALVNLLETVGPDKQAEILTATTSEGFRPEITAHQDSLIGSNRNAEANESRAPYEEVLPNRVIEIFQRTEQLVSPGVSKLVTATPNGYYFHIPLKNGEILTIETNGPLILNRFGVPVGFAAGFLGTLIAIVALVIMQRETTPLARLAAAVDHVELSTDPTPIPDSRMSAPEIRAVIAAFNRLQSRLANMLQARMALIGGISHDVRTFAARLRLRVDQIPEDSERNNAVMDIEDMIHLLDDALLSSKAGAGELIQEMVEIATLVRQETEDRILHGDAVSYHQDAEAESAVVLGDRLALRRIASNIIDNALKYGGKAYVGVSIDEDCAILTVDDDGPGIPPSERELMLEPFSRLEESRNRGTGGAGLGLAIVRSLVEAHYGAIQIAEAPSGGARIRVSLPLFIPTQDDE